MSDGEPLARAERGVIVDAAARAVTAPAGDDGHPAGVPDAEGVVPVLPSHGASGGALLTTLPLAALSGALIATLIAVTLDQSEPTALASSLRFLGGWAVSAVIMAPRSRSILTVVMRGCMLGAVEWLALSLVTPAADVSARTAGQLGEAATRGDVWAHRAEVLTGPLALVMTAACLLGVLISLRLQRDLPRELAD